MSLDLVGKTLGDYRLEDEIGEGGMATVYRAFQVSLNRWVAVKVLYYQESTSLERFKREAKAIAALRHKNILIIYEYGEQDELPYIVMDYVAGGTLEERLTGEPMDWQRVVELAIPIASALGLAHQHGIIHRDVKPSNILMPEEDWPVLADFGLVKRYDEEKGLTMSGTFMGTPSYIAPEQARDMAVDFRADMYSLGVVMFEMLTGAPPFDHENPNKILLAHVMEPPPRPRDLNPECPEALEAVILKMLAKAAEDRYKDMAEVIEALEAVRHTAPAAPVSPPAPPQPAAPSEPESAESGGFGGFFKRMFGGGKKEKAAQVGGLTGSMPTPGPDDDDEFDGTIQLSPEALLGYTAPRLVMTGKDVTIKLPSKPQIIIGRTFGNSVADVDLEPHEASSLGISRQHARLTRQGERWLLEDLNSLNGTFVNGRQLSQGEQAELKDGDRVRFSRLDFTFLTG